MPTIQHVLDNPVWNALISGNKTLALGMDTAKAFPEEVSPIVGLQEYTAANFNALYDIIPHNNPVVVFMVDDPVISDLWSVLVSLTGLQMIYTDSTLPVLEEDEEVASLGDEYIPQMLELTKLTNPGPFSSRTIDFGHYEGIFKEGQLVAMAGQRLQPFDYAEISAVCTHADHTGKGYARQLMLRQVYRIMTSGGIPFLHVRSDNERAINVYKNLGFEVRRSISFFVLQKKRLSKFN